MAKGNIVELFGIIAAEPMIVLDNATGKPRKISFFLNVVNPEREGGTVEFSGENYYYSRPFIYSENAELIEQTKDWHENDIVFIKGVYVTLNAKRGCECPKCHTRAARNAEISLIMPVFMEMRYAGITDAKERMRILNSHREISNQVHLIGGLCEPPFYRKKDSHIYTDLIDKAGRQGLAAYQLAVRRKFYIKEDNPEARVDYPHIVSLGDNAYSDSECLTTGSLVLVDGMIVTREYNRTDVCPKCGEKFDHIENVMEVLSFGTEYLSGCTTLEEKHEAKLKALNEKLEG